tara:strand:- start:1564 stop:1812 length:249 start_codon:yes stop_codon:yes gene_type:complete
MEYIPKDLYKKILHFYLGKCEKCNIQKHYKDIINNCHLYKYLTIFDDDFYIQKPIKYYKTLCKSCELELKKNYTLKNKNIFI